MEKPLEKHHHTKMSLTLQMQVIIVNNISLGLENLFEWKN